MVKKLKKTMKLIPINGIRKFTKLLSARKTQKIISNFLTLLLFLVAQFIGPSVLLAARVAGEDVPIPTMAAPRPDQAPSAVKRPEKKEVPPAFPQSLDKKEPVQAQVESVKNQTQPAPAVPS
ncbi:MAG: hypothetical protein Q8K46_02610, partial [Deltaproteobacteria bacterium]|nr:hypothetical protein [Deltaproteobacteria bacterium]